MKKTYFKFFTPLIKRGKETSSRVSRLQPSGQTLGCHQCTRSLLEHSRADAFTGGLFAAPPLQGSQRSGRETEWPEETEVLPVWTVAELCRLWACPDPGREISGIVGQRVPHCLLGIHARRLALLSSGCGIPPAARDLSLVTCFQSVRL